MRAAVVDTGPLVAFLDRAEHHHRWVAARVEELDTPLLVCEPVLAESMHLLAPFARAQEALFRLLDNRALKIAFHIEEHVPALRKLHQKYRDRPMSLADACMRASCGWPKSMTVTSSLRSIRISRSIANMGASRSRSFTQRRANITVHELVDDTSPGS